LFPQQQNAQPQRTQKAARLDARDAAAFKFAQEGREAAARLNAVRAHSPAPAAAAAAPRPILKSSAPIAQVHFPQDATEDDKQRIKDTVDFVNKLNGYKADYEGKIPHQFANVYTTSMPLDKLRMEYQAVYSLVNANKIPEVISLVCDEAVKTFIKVHSLMGQGHLVDGRVSLLNMYKAAKEQGEFEEEFRQLRIEYAPYFSVGPERRLFGKMALLYTQAVQINSIPDAAFQQLRQRAATAHSEAVNRAAAAFPPPPAAAAAAATAAAATAAAAQ